MVSIERLNRKIVETRFGWDLWIKSSDKWTRIGFLNTGSLAQDWLYNEKL